MRNLPRWLLAPLAIALLVAASAGRAETHDRTLKIAERVDSDKTTVKTGENTEIREKAVDNENELTPEKKRIVMNAKSFLEYQYVEIKDLAKQFLVVIAGVLTLSVAFSEKIVILDKAPLLIRLLMTAIWVACFAASILAGAAIFLIYNAGIAAKYASVHAVMLEVDWTICGYHLAYALTYLGYPLTYPYSLSYFDLLALSQIALTWGGSLFAGALLLFAIIGTWKLFRKPQPGSDAFS
jgi:hypothetical protein